MLICRNSQCCVVVFTWNPKMSQMEPTARFLKYIQQNVWRMLQVLVKTGSWFWSFLKFWSFHAYNMYLGLKNLSAILGYIHTFRKTFLTACSCLEITNRTFPLKALYRWYRKSYIVKPPKWAYSIIICKATQPFCSYLVITISTDTKVKVFNWFFNWMLFQNYWR